jgi:hypothetical protein
VLLVTACATPQTSQGADVEAVEAIEAAPGRVVQVSPHTADGVVAVPKEMTVCLIQDQQVRSLASCALAGGCAMSVPFHSAATGSPNPMILAVVSSDEIGVELGALLAHICVSCVDGVECCPGG